MNTQTYLTELTSAYGPSGDEGAISALLGEKLRPYGSVTIDNMHNVICSIHGVGTHFLLDAHIDQIAFVVTGIDDKGFLKVAKAGGIDPRALLGHEVCVWGDQPLPGIISCQPPHLLTADSYGKSIVLSDLSVDVGLSKEQAEAQITLGDRVTLQYQQCSLLNNVLSASYLDDRSGVTAILLALEQLKRRGAQNPMTVIFSSQEEVGTRGAAVAAFGKEADEAIVVDVSFALTPDSDPAMCGKLGDGPMIGIAPVLSKEIYQGLIRAAAANEIPYQLEVMGETTGTNADVISTTGRGIKTGLISIPQRYMHTPIEAVSLHDVNAVADLITSYLLSKGGETDA